MVYVLLIINVIIGSIAFSIYNFSGKVAIYSGFDRTVADYLMPNWAKLAMFLNFVSLGLIIYIGFDIGFFKTLGLMLIWFLLLMLMPPPKSYCKKVITEKALNLGRTNFEASFHLKTTIDRI